MAALIDIVYVGFFAVMIFSSALWLLVFARNRESAYASPMPDELPSVTFLVPAFNEEDYIETTLERLLALDYPDDRMEIIAINDGSTDSTLEKMHRFADDITIIDKENTGKANSLNVALERVETELVACMDGDSYPESAFLREMVGYFAEDGVKGVTPAMKVDEPRTWVQKVIWAEYVFQIFLRKVFAIFDVQYVLPGPGSLYETDYLKELGGFDEETLTEDMEAAFRMIHDGARIENSSTAYVYTVSPPTLTGLFRQRIRWYRGYIQNLLSYRDMFGNRAYGNLGVFFLPFNLLWLALIMFFTLHLLYNIGRAVRGTISTYFLTGAIPIDPYIGLQSLNVFHVFTAYFVVIGVGTILISLNVAGEDVRPWRRKAHYAMFLLIYPLLFALFWIAALIEHAGTGGDRW